MSAMRSCSSITRELDCSKGIRLTLSVDIQSEFNVSCPTRVGGSGLRTKRGGSSLLQGNRHSWAAFLSRLHDDDGSFALQFRPANRAADRVFLALTITELIV